MRANPGENVQPRISRIDTDWGGGSLSFNTKKTKVTKFRKGWSEARMVKSEE
jgi:hypothetical protein